MLATDTPSFLFSQESRNYSPEDLESMRHAFMRACGENPLAAETETQRYTSGKSHGEHLSAPSQPDRAGCRGNPPGAMKCTCAFGKSSAGNHLRICRGLAGSSLTFDWSPRRQAISFAS